MTKLRVFCVPGLGTAVGRMPYLRCAVQMRTAFDAVIHKDVEDINRPTSLSQCCTSHVNLLQVFKLHVAAMLYSMLPRYCVFP